VSGRRAGSISFDGYISGCAAALTSCPQSLLWLITGHAETITGGTSIAYERADADDTGYSIAALIDGIRYGLAGARANWTWTLTSGNLIQFSCTATGLWQAPADDVIVTPTTLSIIPPKFMGATLTVVDETTTAIIQEMTLDWQNEISIRESAANAAGVAGAALTDSRPIATANPEGVLVADEDRYQTWIDDTLGAFSFVVGSATGNTLTFSASNSRYTEIGTGDRSNFLTNEVGIELVDPDIGSGEGGDFSATWT
jgi:hypothetical protein